MVANYMDKYKGKTMGRLMDIAQALVNAYVRERDSDENGNFVCISCGEEKSKEHCQAGHFFSRGNYNSVRFDLDNIHAECDYCNGFNHDHLIKYQRNLIEKIGIERFNRLEQLAGLKNFKYSRAFLIDLIERYKNIKVDAE